MKYKFLLSCLVCLLIGSVGYASYFNDLELGHDNETAINYLALNDVIEGYSDGSFKADNPINRAEFLKIIVGANFSESEIEACQTSPFYDVPLGAWFTPYICVAEANGVVSGYPDGSFQASNDINFVEASKIISNVFGFYSYDDDLWYRSYVENLEERAAIPASIHYLDKEITRGEMSEMVFRLMTDYQHGEHHAFLDVPLLRGSIETNSCGQDSYTMGFVMMVKPGYEPSYDDLAKWERVRVNSIANFEQATLGRIELDADEFVMLELDDSMIASNSWQDSVMEMDSFLNLDMEKVAQAFYDENPDKYEFLTFYTPFFLEYPGPPVHQVVSNDITNIGLDIMDFSNDYGSDGVLKGFSIMNDIKDSKFMTNVFTHETGHQWCCYTEDSDEYHFDAGLEGPVSSAALAPAADHFYLFNEDDEEALKVETYGVDYFVQFHPFTQYMMGILPESEYDKEYSFYDVDGDHAHFIKSRSVNDIVREQGGHRSCD